MAVERTPESRTAGAPSGDLGIDRDLRPKKKPKSPKHAQLQAALEREGLPPERAAIRAQEIIDQDEADAAARAAEGPAPLREDERELEAYRASQRDMMADSVDPPPSTPQQDQWDRWVRSSPSRMEQYDPQGFAAMQAAKDEERYGRIGETYGQGEADAARDADKRGVVRIPQSMSSAARNAERKYNERASRGEKVSYERGQDGKVTATVGPARERLMAQDARQAESNKAFRAQARAGGLEAKRKESAHAAAMEEARMQDPRYRAWRSQMMLSGGQPNRNQKASINALNELPEEQQNAALQYIVAGGRGATPLDVERAGGEQMIRMLLGQNIGAMMNPANARAAEIAARNAEREANKDSEDAIADQYASRGWLGYGEFEPAEQAQMYDELVGMGYSHAEAVRVVRRIASERRASRHHNFGTGQAQPQPTPPQGAGVGGGAI